MGYLNHATATDGGATGASVVNDKPSGTSDGDIMVWAIHSDQVASVQSYSFPAGWTQIPAAEGEADSTVDQASLAVAYKVASGEGANYTCTLSAADWWASVIVTYNNCPASPYDTQSNTGSDTTADAGPSWTIDATSLTTATDNEVLLWFAAIDCVSDTATTGSITYVEPSGFTPRGSVADTNWCSIAWADKLQAVAGATGSITGSATVASSTANAGQIAVLVAIKQNTSTGNIAWIRA
jgi:hypothetical protein